MKKRIGKNKKIITNNIILAEQNLLKLSHAKIEEIFSELNTDNLGLTNQSAEDRIEEFGYNKIIVGKKNKTLKRLFEAVFNPFNIVLLIIAAINFVNDVLIATKKDYLTVGIILSLVIISSMVGFIQSEKSNKAAEKLSKIIENKAHIWRDKKLQEIPIELIVPGDIIKLSAGDILPGDIRFITAKDVFVSQSALTGESQPVEKFAKPILEDVKALTDLNNLGFMGSNMISGSGTAVVLSTGNQTYFGAMAKTLSGNKAQNSFERGISSVSKLLITLMVVVVPIVFFINGFTKGSWLNAFIFAITIAVGLTPEMLPVIMTSTLAKGAITMSRRRVIVKNLGSIQVFGEMDILCTDKTGTLTEDKIVLEKYMNVYGNDDVRVLRHAYLNSHFQTGLKNLIDVAIINRATSYELDAITSRYKCIDEVPFDFTRRRMSVIIEDESGKQQLITKGAVEEVISVCSFIELDGKILKLDEKSRKKAMDIYLNYNNDGLRMIAVAQKNDISHINEFKAEDETDMVLIGFIGFLDPPKESAKPAIAALKQHGVRTVVLTGDSMGVAVKVCSKVGVKTENALSGDDIEKLSDDELLNVVDDCDLFAKLSPSQKQRIVEAYQKKGHTVGYMGDGINDTPPLQQSDVGISVDSAVDIAKETADIILLEKDLDVLEGGVIEGRKTFGNIIKYIKMTISGNFGNIISVIAASLLFPFLPMLPIQILVQNLLCDFSQLGISFDGVDDEYLLKPRKWETKTIKRFMYIMGPVSSLFDILLFAVAWYILKANTQNMAPLFQGAWFVFGTVSQVLVIHMIRTGKIPFIQSRAKAPFMISTILVAIIGIVIGFTNLAKGIDLFKLPLSFAPWLILLLLGYFVTVQFIKKWYIKKYKEWL